MKINGYTVYQENNFLDYSETLANCDDIDRYSISSKKIKNIIKNQPIGSRNPLL
jgi:hypothetical protein